MPRESLRGVIFDMDGTLVSLQADGSELRHATMAELERAGFLIDRIDDKGYVQEILDQARAQAEGGQVKADYQKARARAYRAMDDLEMVWIRGARPLPHALEVVEHLNRRPGLKIGVLTNSGRPATDHAMQGMGFGRLVHNIFTRDDVPEMKPRHEGLEAAVRAMGLRPDEALYVGDSTIDIEAARGAGVRVASIATGRHERRSLDKAKPDYVLDSFHDLEGLVERLT